MLGRFGLVGAVSVEKAGVLRTRSRRITVRGGVVRLHLGLKFPSAALVLRHRSLKKSVARIFATAVDRWYSSMLMGRAVYATHACARHPQSVRHQQHAYVDILAHSICNAGRRDAL
jgi:hypothetical protein